MVVDALEVGGVEIVYDTDDILVPSLEPRAQEFIYLIAVNDVVKVVVKTLQMELRGCYLVNLSIGER